MDEAAVAQALQLLVAHVVAAFGALAADQIAQAVLGIAVDDAEALGGGDDGKNQLFQLNSLSAGLSSSFRLNIRTKAAAAFSPP